MGALQYHSFVAKHDSWACELCGRTHKGRSIAYKIFKQLHGETKELLVCDDCNRRHEKELELTRQNFQMQFGDEPKVEKKTYEYKVTFHLTSGKMLGFPIESCESATLDVAEEIVDKTYYSPSPLSDSDNRVIINMSNVEYFVVHKKEEEEE